MARRAPVSHSKYRQVLASRQALPAENVEYQDRVEVVKTQIRQHNLSSTTLGMHYARLRAEKERIEGMLSDVNLKLEAHTQLLIESHEHGEEGWGAYGAPKTVLRMASGDSLRLQPEPYSTVEDRNALRQYFIEKGLTNLLTPPWQTVNSHNKDRLLNGEPELPGTKVWIKTKLFYTQLKEDDVPTTLLEEEQT